MSEQNFHDAVIDELVAAHIYRKEHDTDPTKAIKDVIDWNVMVALDPAVSNSAAAKVNARLSKALGLLLKHGVCLNCGELYEHHEDEPFASCMCGTSEWHHFTPHMRRVIDLKLINNSIAGGNSNAKAD